MGLSIRNTISISSFQLGTTLLFFLLSFSSSFLTPLSMLMKLDTGLNPIQRENQQPGTSDWRLTHPAQENTRLDDYPAIEGYAWATSVEAGNKIQFSVSTTSSSFSADIYRMGWYQGKGGRLIQSISSIRGNTYPVPTPNISTGLVEAKWPVAFILQTQTQWVSGMYMVKLTAANRQQSYIPIVY